MRPSANGVSGACTRPNLKALTFLSFRSPAMRLAVDDAELYQTLLDGFPPFGRSRRQRRPGRADRAPHDHAAAFQRRRILVAEQEPELRQLVLRGPGAIPVAGST